MDEYPMLIEVEPGDFECFQYYYCRITLTSSRDWSMEIFDDQQTRVGWLEVEREGDELSGDALVKAVNDWAWHCVGHRKGFFSSQPAPAGATAQSQDC